MRWSIALSISALLASQAAYSAPLTFRDLGSASTWLQVQRAYPEAEVERTCRNGETLSQSADGVTLCDWLETKLELDGNIYNASFIFNPDRTLRYISLIKIYGHGATPASKDDIPKANAAARSLADLLSTKYGPPVHEAPGDILKSKDDLLKLEWQPGRGTKWQSGGDRIKLRAGARQVRSQPQSYMVDIQLFYTFARATSLDDI